MWSGAAAAAAAARAVSPPLHAPTSLSGRRGAGRPSTVSVRAGGGLMDFVGGDLVKPDLGRWLDDVEEHKALAIYPPHEGGYEGRYLNRLRYQGYYFLDMSARGLGDPEATLTKIHPVCPVRLPADRSVSLLSSTSSPPDLLPWMLLQPSLGRQPIARWYFPPEVDYRLSLLHPDAKGLVVWVLEAKVSRRSQFLAMNLGKIFSPAICFCH